MIRTFRYPLHPTKAQEATFETWLEMCRQLYNGALQERRDAWKRCKINVSHYTQQVSLTELRREPEWGAIPVWAERSALARVDRAFQAFFRRCKAGEKPGYPRFKPFSRYQSFGIGSVASRHVSVKGSTVRIPKLGWVRFNQYRPIKGTIKDVEVSKECGKWFVCFACDLGDAPAKIPISSSVGIDLGLTNFITTSNGEATTNPRFYALAEAKVSRMMSALARKKRGSARRRRARICVSKSHAHIRRQRVDFARKLACSLFDRFDLVAYEDLEIRRLLHSSLRKSIHDAAWGRFIYALTCKAESAGKHVIAVNPHGTSQRCSQCGDTVSKTLKERTHSCPGCGLVLDRDHNAAINVLKLALAALPEALGEVTLVDRGSPVGNEKPSFGQGPCKIRAEMHAFRVLIKKPFR